MKQSLKHCRNLELLVEDNELIHERIRELVALHQGPKVVIGGPPCQAYSLAGVRVMLESKGYKAEDDHRNFLYKEILKSIVYSTNLMCLLWKNVRGILSAKINGEAIFPQILEDLRKSKSSNQISRSF